MNKNGYYDYAGIYVSIFGAIGVLTPLIGQYLAGIGFTGLQIGIIMSVATTVGILASPLWGYRYQRSKESMNVVIFLCVSATMLMLGIVFIKSYLPFLILYAVFSFFQTPIIPLCDAMTLTEKIPYGAVRKWGAISFAVGVFAAGQISEATDLVTIFPLCALGYSMTWIIVMRMKKKQNCKQASDSKTKFIAARHDASRVADSENDNLELKAKKNGGYAALFGNKKLMALLLSAFFICGTNIGNNTYYGFLYKDVGGSIAGIGISLLLMCGSEAPFMAWAERISSKFTLEKMILISMIISALRYFWYSTGPTPELLIGTFFLQGMVNGIVLVELVRYVVKLVEPELLGMAMTMYQSISSGCSTILCQLISGTILDYYSSLGIYLFFGIYNTIGIILYVAFGLYKSNEKK